MHSTRMSPPWGSPFNDTQQIQIKRVYREFCTVRMVILGCICLHRLTYPMYIPLSYIHTILTYALYSLAPCARHCLNTLCNTYANYTIMPMTTHSYIHMPIVHMLLCPQILLTALYYISQYLSILFSNLPHMRVYVCTEPYS